MENPYTVLYASTAQQLERELNDLHQKGYDFLFATTTCTDDDAQGPLGLVVMKKRS